MTQITNKSKIEMNLHYYKLLKKEYDIFKQKEQELLMNLDQSRKLKKVSHEIRSPGMEST